MKISAINSKNIDKSGQTENIQQLTKRLDNIQKRIIELEQQMQNKDYNLPTQAAKGGQTKHDAENMSEADKRQLKQEEIENLKAQAEMIQEKIQNLRKQSVKSTSGKTMPVYSAATAIPDTEKASAVAPAALYEKTALDKK